MDDDIRTWRTERGTELANLPKPEPVKSDPVAWIDPFEKACLWTGAICFALAGVCMLLEVLRG